MFGTTKGFILPWLRAFISIRRCCIPGMLALLHPAPPHGKLGCPAPQKASLAPPCPLKIEKPAGRNGAKLTVNYTDYAPKFRLRVGR